MYLTPLQTLTIILAVAAGTQITRWLPFWMFPENKEPPAVVTYLGKVLPPATMVLLHRWKNNVLLSIAGGTAVYMLLVQVIFA